MSEPRRKKKFHLRSLTSFVITLSFVTMSISGLVLYLAPPGGRARMTDWRYCGLARDGWMAQHMTSCAVFLLFGIIHLCLNARVLWNYVRSKPSGRFRRKWELAIAAAVIAFMAVGTAYEVPPWNYIVTGSWHLRAYRQERGRQGHGRQGQGREHRGYGRGQGEGQHRGPPPDRGPRRYRGQRPVGSDVD